MANIVLEDTLTFEELSVPGYEKVLKVTDASAGLSAIICIHDSRLSKTSLGGTRIYAYANFDEALKDALRLARGMTYKSAIAECSWAGAKSVIIADGTKKKPLKLLEAFGEAVSRLKGEYICAEDLGCNPEDIFAISKKTPYVVGIPHEKSSGNPAPFTAWGVFRGIQAVLKKVTHSESVQGRTIALQGVGNAGRRVAEYLFWHGAKLIITDVDQEKAKSVAKDLGAKVVAPDQIYSEACDVFAPCALGGILNASTIPLLRCAAVAGAANNQLLAEEDGEYLMRRNILYAPDFVINSGGLINVTCETLEEGYNPYIARQRVDKIYEQLMLIFEIAGHNRISTEKAAVQLAEYRLRYGVGRRQDPVYLHHAQVSY